MFVGAKEQSPADVLATLRACLPPKGTRGVKSNPPLERKQKIWKRRPIIAYDLETTNIAAGTPDVLYITGFAGGEKPFRLSLPINGANREDRLRDLLTVLTTHFLIPEHNNMRFVAWNANNFDAFFIAQACLLSDDFAIYPYLTKSNALRGMKIEHRETKQKWEFLDGMSMTGLDAARMPLKKFLSMYAPEYAKLELDFAHESFNANNPRHVAYAERDSEGLWHAMQAANDVLIKLTGNEAQPTMGRLAIHHMIANIPEGVQVWKATEGAHEVLSTHAKRGGFVWIAKQYEGLIWKYDLNQAYAAAMRECDYPHGMQSRTDEYVPGLCGVYHVRLSRAERATVPFYYKTFEHGRGAFTCGAGVECWIMSNEYEHLIADDWRVEIVAGYVWSETYRMTDFVNDLERTRQTDPAGPSGPLGTMVKQLGNSAYGKTLENLTGKRIVLSRTQPEGFMPLQDEESDILAPYAGVLWVAVEDALTREYHRPQIGCFTTAHVRMKVRQAAIENAAAFVYADTDCVCFSKPVVLDTDPRRYGAWKLEAEGVEYMFLGKKIYWGADGTKHAKGLRLRDLDHDDFILWSNGHIPDQHQLQRNNFLKHVRGVDMFKYQSRSGTDVTKSKTVKFEQGFFSPIEEKPLQNAA